MSKMTDMRAVTYPVTVLDTEAEVTTVQTSKTVFEAYGDLKGRRIVAKGGTRLGALNRWRYLAERSED